MIYLYLDSDALVVDGLLLKQPICTDHVMAFDVLTISILIGCLSCLIVKPFILYVTLNSLVYLIFINQHRTST